MAGLGRSFRSLIPCLLALALVFQYGGLVGAETRLARDLAGLRDALNDSSVDHVILGQRAGGYSMSDEAIPENSLWLEGRTVLLEGEGPDQVYMDSNSLTARIVVTSGGQLHQKNLWADDCFKKHDLSVCFSKIVNNGRVVLDSMQISDANCLVLSQSSGIQGILDAIRYVRLVGLGGPADVEAGENVVEVLSPREVLITDSGWINFPLGSLWRCINTTLSCTGNVTHPLSYDADLSPVWTFGSLLLVTGSVCFGALVAGIGTLVAWRRRRRTTAAAGDSLLADLPEQTVAKKHGYALLRLLGVGHYGRVFLASQEATGELFAIKVITVYTLRQLEAAFSECHTMLAIRHPNCARVHTYFSARMAHRLMPVGSGGADGAYLEQAFTLESSTPSAEGSVLGAGGSSRGGGSSSGANSSRGSLRGVSLPSGGALAEMLLAGPSSWRAAAGSRSSSSGTSSRGTTASGGIGGSQGSGSIAVQVHMVVDYCDRGTLEGAILGGLFADAVTGRPRLDWVLATAVDMMAGLEYLHAPERRFVHRDLSACNILLKSRGGGSSGSGVDAPGPSDRPFSAVISDFGLSMMLATQTHKTSQMKGTVIYMSPEVFTTNNITQALDIYSFGIIFYYLYTGELPYKDRSPGQVIMEKMKEVDTPPEQRFDIPPNCPEGYRSIILDATNPDRRQRPTATQLLGRLRSLLSTVLGE